MPPRPYQKRSRGLFDPASSEPFRISRSKIDLYVECPRCFYLDQRLGCPRTQFPAFTLNNAVDELLKREFDIHRSEGTSHPLMKKNGVEAVPLDDPRMEEWRDALRRGVQRLHAPSNLLVRGGVDDIWRAKSGEWIVVDYKATSKKDEPTLDGYWQQAYKRQVEVYQWLLRGHTEKVSNTAYFVYVNGKANAKKFDWKLEFDVNLIAYEGKDSWIEPALLKIAEVLKSEEVPPAWEHCEYCGYRTTVGKELQSIIKTGKKTGNGTLGI